MSTVWSVYLLRSGTRTYIGSTTDPVRRLRQHNGEIVGGARATRSGRPWSRVCWISGFSNRSSACRWEKLLKVRCRGVDGRTAGFHSVSEGECPPYRRRPQYPIPEGLQLHVT